ncbi:MAG TPA: glutamine--fructose-6-phosphate transaminase (isomerizing) [Candidatus Binatia bacterium]|nr:glutamine--fructose-6-phosphate transaminase (isomerizing) [Candidatus Binatia bacterium]
MCGIVGYVGPREASDVLVSALKRLEYRGYDSAGVAALDGDGIEVRRCVGKLGNLEQLLIKNPLAGSIGIGHTRWATHGRPSEENAHPHRAGHVVLIHNGIIENYLELRAEVVSRGRTLRSETDSEVIAHLIDEEIQRGLSLVEATRRAVQKLHGSFSIVVMSELERDRLVAAKTATPIVIGLGEKENLIASDIPAILEYTRDMIFLEDGEIAEVTREAVTLSDFAGRPRTRPPRRVTWDAVTAQKGGYRHFLLKEIHEQPQALIDTLRGRIRLESGDVDLAELNGLAKRLDRVERITLTACGTAWHATLVGKFFLNQLTRLPVEVDYASEFRYRNPVLGERDLLVVVSQSGETADTLGAVEEAKRCGAQTLAICNVVDSSIARRSDAVVYTHAGPEISVASTKAFTTQLAAFFLLAVNFGRRLGRLSAEEARSLLTQLRNIPQLTEQTLPLGEQAAQLARKYAQARDFLYLGRGINYPIALEGALKLKELSYIHAEGYPAGEMKHGPIALITEATPVVVLAPYDHVYAKTVSNLKEVESRGGKIIVVTDRRSDDLSKMAADVLVVPATGPLLSPFLLTVPLQLLAYHVAVERGSDVDQPRNLAKSVTVE